MSFPVPDLENIKHDLDSIPPYEYTPDVFIQTIIGAVTLAAIIGLVAWAWLAPLVLGFTVAAIGVSYLVGRMVCSIH
ncbi:hypothetical protein A7981_05610 [Methylovorus sp. MM2]|uniref:hypothetical protein n=1 Tax=Methylovorus sp. MM2 TaxID=1848038 RepID=UPI0007DE8C4D|nr:hypothetical protein [Methylovorus sp. MM2]OAM52913.1 hypothetical protein A7981_05610 [Methylovorus sp. MM2]